MKSFVSKAGGKRLSAAGDARLTEPAGTAECTTALDNDRREVRRYSDQILTWDDGPWPPAAELIVRRACQSPKVKIEFYWNGASMLREDVRSALEIFEFESIPRCREGRWIPWMEWLESQRQGTNMRDFLDQIIDSDVMRACRAITAVVGPAVVGDLIGYHGMTHEYSTSPSHPMQFASAQFQQEFRFFDLLVQHAFHSPDYRVKFGRTPYGSGLLFDFPNAAQQHHHRYSELCKRAQVARPGFNWHAWEVDTEDYFNQGVFDENEIVTLAEERGRDRLSVRVLMHERYYAMRNGTIERLFSRVRRARE